MWFLWNKVATKLEVMKAAESRLMEYAHRFGGNDDDEFDDASYYDMEVFDTEIPGDVVPLKQHNNKKKKNPPPLTIHGIHLWNKHSNSNSKQNENKEQQQQKQQAPLVLVHGYANGALYFYRNLVGLTRYFSNVYSLDWLGWGLSSRPRFQLKDSSTETAEAFFVESLEAWRRVHGIDKMVLAGHSIGGYLSVAYCERYPQHVERLILLSPAGVKEETAEDREKLERWRQRSSLLGRTALSIIPLFFDMGTTPCSVLRTVPQGTGYGWVENYVERRLPAITAREERAAITEYLYHNATLPGSGEYALNKLLKVNTLGRNPLALRIPHLKVSHVTLLYGDDDWMDSTGGLQTQQHCERVATAPKIQVLEVPHAGHLLMLDNWKYFNAGVVLGGLGPSALPSYAPKPRLLLPRRSTQDVLLNPNPNTSPSSTTQQQQPQAVSVQA